MEVYGTTVHLVNRTPHEVVVVRDDQEVLRLPKCDDPVRLHELEVSEEVLEYEIPNSTGESVPLAVKKFSLSGIPSPSWIPEYEYKQECFCSGPEHGRPGEGGVCKCGTTFFVPIVFIVSLPVLKVMAATGIHRKDLVAPDMGPTAIRNERGQVVAVRRLMRLASE
ncbi:MAG: hypothetical protein KatS3mg023_3663 [Armatimonadota bacterium]|nr:MAG: hypothetical protein KatS3mg023_3663 [Armatimonadota bacterium]